MSRFKIIKNNGDKVSFNRDKLISSLTKSGASKTEIERITTEIEAYLYDGISTKKIYKKAFTLLKEHSRSTASRYKLKKAIMELGPTGFPFEKLIGDLLSHEGFKTEVGVIVKGHCVQHEVDVVAKKENNHFMIECKYHSDRLRFCNVKVPLYIQSRFLDVEKQWKKQPNHKTKFHKGWVYTNTRFTSDAIQYGTCEGLGLVSWNYPHQNSLKERIDKSGLHPLTSLTNLTKAEKTKLLDKGIVLCRDVYHNPKFLEEIGISKNRLNNILKDSQELCSPHQVY